MTKDRSRRLAAKRARRAARLTRLTSVIPPGERPLLAFGGCIHDLAEKAARVEVAQGDFLVAVFAAEDVAILTRTNICRRKNCRVDHQGEAKKLLRDAMTEFAVGRARCWRSVGFTVSSERIPPVVDAAALRAMFPPLKH